MPQQRVGFGSRLAAGLCFMLFTFASTAFAQSTFGTILGTVSDSQNALIAHASVVITNVDENTTRVL